MALYYSSTELEQLSDKDISSLLAELDVICSSFISSVASGRIDEEAAEEWLDYRDIVRSAVDHRCWAPELKGAKGK